MVQIAVDGSPILFTVRVSTYDALLQAIVRRTKTNKILPIFYLDKTKELFVRLQPDDVQPFLRKTHVKLRLGGQETVPYEGELNSEGKKHGQGIYRWPNGRTYVGEWCDNQMQGEGVESWPNGSRYEGQFKGNKRHGQGTFTWADGRQYVGEYRHDARHGFGVCTSPKGYRYEGEWVNGKKHGRGIEIYPDGHRFSGIFQNDKPLVPDSEQD